MNHDGFISIEEHEKVVAKLTENTKKIPFEEKELFYLDSYTSKITIPEIGISNRIAFSKSCCGLLSIHSLIVGKFIIIQDEIISEAYTDPGSLIDEIKLYPSYQIRLTVINKSFYPVKLNAWFAYK